MLESVIYARDHFLRLPSPNDDNTPDQMESIALFPSHAYLVRFISHFHRFFFNIRFSIVLHLLIKIFVLNRIVCGRITSI